MFYNGPRDNEPPNPPHNHPVPYGNRPTTNSQYPIEIRQKALAIRDRIERELRTFGRAPTEDEASMLILVREIIEGPANV